MTSKEETELLEAAYEKFQQREAPGPIAERKAFVDVVRREIHDERARVAGQAMDLLKKHGMGNESPVFADMCLLQLPNWREHIEALDKIKGGRRGP